MASFQIPVLSLGLGWLPPSTPSSENVRSSRISTVVLSPSLCQGRIKANTATPNPDSLPSRSEGWHLPSLCSSGHIAGTFHMRSQSVYSFVYILTWHKKIFNMPVLFNLARKTPLWGGGSDQSVGLKKIWRPERWSHLPQVTLLIKNQDLDSNPDIYVFKLPLPASYISGCFPSHDALSHWFHNVKSIAFIA